MRQPLGRREASIIKRMKKVGMMAVQKIALITERHKKTIYNVLNNKAKFAKRGPKANRTRWAGQPHQTGKPTAPGERPLQCPL